MNHEAATEVQNRLLHHIQRAEEAIRTIMDHLAAYKSAQNPDWSYVGSAEHIAQKLEEISEGYLG